MKNNKSIKIEPQQNKQISEEKNTNADISKPTDK